jgi:hypothetical protein
MTPAEFAAAASHCYDNWWLTGEDSFLHIPSVMNIEGWNLYGHPNQGLLTEPQRVLMMWSDLVGQTSNGGFVQFVDNFSERLALAHASIAKLGWPELFERFDRAFREQAGDPADPKPRMDPWSEADDAATERGHMIRELARIRTRWRPWARRSQEKTLELFSDTLLSSLYIKAIAGGEIAAPSGLVAEEDEPPSQAAEAFDDWFYRDETRAASRIHIRDYILRHRDSLCRLTG